MTTTFNDKCPNIVIQSNVIFNHFHLNDYGQNYDYITIDMTIINTNSNYN